MHNLLSFFHVRPANQHTISGVALFHKTRLENHDVYPEFLRAPLKWDMEEVEKYGLEGTETGLHKLHGYTVHQQYWTLFYYQLMHTTLKNAELLKHFKLDKNAPTCFGLHRNHLQGAKVSAWLKITRLVDSICVKDVQGVVSVMAAYCDL